MSTEARKLFEPDNTIELLRGWLQHAYKARQRHDLAAKKYDRYRVWLGAFAAILAALVGTSVFAALKENSDSTIKILFALGSVLSAILGGLNSFLNLAERVEKHRTAVVRYKAIVRDFERILSQKENVAALPTGEIERIQVRLNELEENAPIVTEKIYAAVDSDWNNRGVTAVSNADNLYALNPK